MELHWRFLSRRATIVSSSNPLSKDRLVSRVLMRWESLLLLLILLVVLSRWRILVIATLLLVVSSSKSLVILLIHATTKLSITLRCFLVILLFCLAIGNSTATIEVLLLWRFTELISAERRIWIHIVLFECRRLVRNWFIKSKTEVAFPTWWVVYFYRSFLFWIHSISSIALLLWRLLLWVIRLHLLMSPKVIFLVCILVYRFARRSCIAYIFSRYLSIVAFICILLIWSLISLNLVFVLFLIWWCRVLAYTSIIIPANAPLTVAT